VTIQEFAGAENEQRLRLEPLNCLTLKILAQNAEYLPPDFLSSPGDRFIPATASGAADSSKSAA